jgi:hypothetical protein
VERIYFVNRLDGWVAGNDLMLSEKPRPCCDAR